MRRVKGLLILAAMLGMALSASAQFHFGFRAGMGFPNMKTTLTVGNDTKVTKTDRLMVGFNMGISGLYIKPIAFGNIEFEGDLLFSRLGGQLKAEGPFGGYLKTTTSLYYMQLPIRVNYSIPVGPMDIYIGAGPQFGVGLAGNSKVAGKLGADGKESSSKTKVEWGGDTGYQRFDMNVSLQAGFRWREPMIGAAFYYNPGFMNIGSKAAKALNAKVINSSDLGFQLFFYF